MQKHVEIYTTPTCHFCHMAKEFMAKHHVSFIEHNVAQDADKRQEMVTKTGQLGVPVIVVDGQVMIGFDEQQLGSLLGISSSSQ